MKKTGQKRSAEVQGVNASQWERHQRKIQRENAQMPAEIRVMLTNEGRERRA